LKLIHGTDLVGDEFLKVFSVSQALHTFVDNFVQNQQLKNFIQKYADIKSCNNKSKINSVDLKLSKLVSPLNKRFEYLLNSSKLKFKKIKFTNRVSISGILFTDSSNKSRFNNSCVQLKNGDYGIIYKIVVTEERKVYFLIKRIVKLLDCFFNYKYPRYKSSLFLCSISDEYFIYTIDSVKKMFLININEELNFISSFNMNHLFT
jgi:hypothetical protein